MAAIPVGKVTVFSIDGTIKYSGVGVETMDTDENVIDAVDYEESYDEVMRNHDDGEVKSGWLYNKRENITIRFYPASANTGAGEIANAKDNVLLPAVPANVVIEDMAGDVLNDGEDGEGTPTPPYWKYLGGGTIVESQTGEVEMVLPLRQYASDLAINNT